MARYAVTLFILMSDFLLFICSVDCSYDKRNNGSAFIADANEDSLESTAVVTALSATAHIQIKPTGKSTKDKLKIYFESVHGEQDSITIKWKLNIERKRISKRSEMVKVKKIAFILPVEITVRVRQFSTLFIRGRRIHDEIPIPEADQYIRNKSYSYKMSNLHPNTGYQVCLITKNIQIIDKVNNLVNFGNQHINNTNGDNKHFEICKEIVTKSSIIDNSEKERKIAIISSVSSASTVVFIFVVCCCCCKRSKKQRKNKANYSLDYRENKNNNENNKHNDDNNSNNTNSNNSSSNKINCNEQSNKKCNKISRWLDRSTQTPTSTLDYKSANKIKYQSMNRLKINYEKLNYILTEDTCYNLLNENHHDSMPFSSDHLYSKYYNRRFNSWPLNLQDNQSRRNSESTGYDSDTETSTLKDDARSQSSEIFQASPAFWFQSASNQKTKSLDNMLYIRIPDIS